LLKAGEISPMEYIASLLLWPEIRDSWKRSGRSTCGVDRLCRI